MVRYYTAQRDGCHDPSASDLDEKIVAAFRADAREQLSEMASSVAEPCKATGTRTHRKVSIQTCCGRIVFGFPYAPRAGVSNAALEKFGC